MKTGNIFIIYREGTIGWTPRDDRSYVMSGGDYGGYLPGLHSGVKGVPSV